MATKARSVVEAAMAASLEDGPDSGANIDAREDTASGILQHDYVAPGSDGHAESIGLRRVSEIDAEDPLQMDGWTLEDPTAYGAAATHDFLMRILRQKVNALHSPEPTVVEHEYRTGATRNPDGSITVFAPPMWNPRGLRRDAGVAITHTSG